MEHPYQFWKCRARYAIRNPFRGLNANSPSSTEKISRPHLIRRRSAPAPCTMPTNRPAVTIATEPLSIHALHLQIPRRSGMERQCTQITVPTGVYSTVTATAAPSTLSLNTVYTGTTEYVCVCGSLLVHVRVSESEVSSKRASPSYGEARESCGVLALFVRELRRLRRDHEIARLPADALADDLSARQRLELIGL